MSPFKKSDVKSHLSARGRAESGTFLNANKLDIPGFSPEQAAALKSDPDGFVADFIEEHVERITLVETATTSLDK